jgi:hypothetical protein
VVENVVQPSRVWGETRHTSTYTLGVGTEWGRYVNLLYRCFRFGVRRRDRQRGLDPRLVGTPESL